MKVYVVKVTDDGDHSALVAIFARSEDAEAEAERLREEYRATINGWTRWWVEEWDLR